jgi:hypothetical protein
MFGGIGKSLKGFFKNFGSGGSGGSGEPGKGILSQLIGGIFGKQENQGNQEKQGKWYEQTWLWGAISAGVGFLMMLIMIVSSSKRPNYVRRRR